MIWLCRIAVLSHWHWHCYRHWATVSMPQLLVATRMLHNAHMLIRLASERRSSSTTVIIHSMTLCVGSEPSAVRKNRLRLGRGSDAKTRALN